MTLTKLEPVPPLLVLDTNVVLAWLLFRDPCCLRLADAIMSGRRRWIASPAMRGELEHVLGRGIPSARAGEPGVVLAAWKRWAAIVEPSDRPSARGLHCTDRDDQKFIDLALQVRASALVSHDRAVLRLARRARAHDLAIVSVVGWEQRLDGSAAG